jgi:hypothetical protein
MKLIFEEEENPLMSSFLNIFPDAAVERDGDLLFPS